MSLPMSKVVERIGYKLQRLVRLYREDPDGPGHAANLFTWLENYSSKSSSSATAKPAPNPDVITLKAFKDRIRTVNDDTFKAALDEEVTGVETLINKDEPSAQVDINKRIRGLKDSLSKYDEIMKMINDADGDLDPKLLPLLKKLGISKADNDKTLTAAKKIVEESLKTEEATSMPSLDSDDEGIDHKTYFDHIKELLEKDDTDIDDDERTRFDQTVKKIEELITGGKGWEDPDIIRYVERVSERWDAHQDMVQEKRTMIQEMINGVDENIHPILQPMLDELGHSKTDNARVLKSAKRLIAAHNTLKKINLREELEKSR